MLLRLLFKKTIKYLIIFFDIIIIVMKLDCFIKSIFIFLFN